MEEKMYVVRHGIMRHKLSEFHDAVEAINFAADAWKLFKQHGRERVVEIFYDGELYYQVLGYIPTLT